MAYRIRRMPLAPEVYVLQAEVGGDQGFMAARKRQHRTVVPDASAGVLSMQGCCATDPFDQRLFFQRHSSPSYGSQPNIPEAVRCNAAIRSEERRVGKECRSR